jgi:hypothetical protein
VRVTSAFERKDYGSLRGFADREEQSQFSHCGLGTEPHRDAPMRLGTGGSRGPVVQTKPVAPARQEGQLLREKGVMTNRNRIGPRQNKANLGRRAAHGYASNRRHCTRVALPTIPLFHHSNVPIEAR